MTLSVFKGLSKPEVRYTASVLVLAWSVTLLVAFLSLPFLVKGGAGPSSIVQAFGKLQGNACSVPVVCSFVAWDALWYHDVAQNGYSFDPNNLSNIVFFPLFPLAMGLLGLLVGNLHLAGFLLANASLFLALLLLLRLARMDYTESIARRSLLYLLLFPASYFLWVPYPESLFLLLSVASFYYARKGNWSLAGAAGFLAGLTRPVGFLLALPLAYEYLSSRKLAPSFAFALAPLVGLAAYEAYLWATFGDPGVYFKARDLFIPIRTTAPWVTLAPKHPADVVLLVGLALGLAGLWLAWRQRMRPSYLLHAAATPALLLGVGQLIGAIRYEQVLFPLFFAFAAAGERPWVDRAVLVFFSGLLALTTALFVNEYWGLF